MPGGFYEHYLIRIGGCSGRDEIKTAMSPRACYTYFKRHLTSRAVDGGQSGENNGQVALPTATNA